MNKSKINKINNQFFFINYNSDNLKFVHSGCWNTECKNKINFDKLSKNQYINTVLYNQLYITTQINKEDIDFLSLIGDNIYQKYYEPENMDPLSLLYKIPDGLKCIEKFTLLGLGNHDVSDKETYETVLKLDESDKLFIPNDYYCLIIRLNGFRVKLIYINTNILNDYETTEPYYRTLSKEDYEKIQELQFKFIDEAINSGDYHTEYTFVLGHEPIIYVPHKNQILDETDKSNFKILNRMINNNNVDFYLNADEHNLQSITSKMSKLKYITSGGGGALGDFPKGLYDLKKENKEVIIQDDKYLVNNVIASHGYVKFEIKKEELKYNFIVPEYVSNNLDNTIDILENKIFDVPFKVIGTDIPTTLYISPKCDNKEGGSNNYYEKYIKYKNKYIKLKNYKSELK